MKVLGILFLMTILNFSAEGSQLSENFTTRTYWDTANSTGIWNSALGYAHAPLALDATAAAGVNENSVIDIGNGSDGPFDVNTYASFSVGGSVAGNIITIDTAAHPSLQFTYFYLAPGWTLRGTGANALWIKVLGNFTNAGTIDCSGLQGDGTNTVTSTTTNGGVGRCGGGSGGAGGNSGAAAVVGGSGCTVPACGVLAGGNPGTTQVTNSGGGGGGGGYYSAAGGSVGTGTGPGGGGASILDPSMTKIGTAAGGPGGGSGGGGGGNATGAGASAGGGGGAGGGVIRISCVGDFANSGTITADGGVGGSGSGPDRAGAGGGGAGGSIWILAAGNYSNAGGSVSALGGNGGTGVGGGGNGGAGATGRTWITQGKNYTGPSENLPANMADFGIVRFSEQSYTLQSLPYDLRNTKPTINSVTLSSNGAGASTATLMIAGSDDNFVSSDTGFVPATSVATLNGKRYFRFKIIFQYISSPAATAAPIPATLQFSSVTVNYDGSKQATFNFTPACGYIGGPEELLFLLSLLMLAYFLMKRSPAYSKPEINS